MNFSDMDSKNYYTKVKKKNEIFLSRSRRQMNTAGAAVSCIVMASLRTNLNNALLV